jgi:transcriptional regulator with XRE-family HTH domain
MENINKYYEMSDVALLQLLGDFVREKRIAQNKTQQQVSDAAGINRSTLIQMENGKGGRLNNFVQVLRMLQQLHVLNIFEVQQQMSPLLLAKLEQQKRQRARPKESSENDNPTW